MALSVLLAGSALSVDPGGFVRADVRVRNTGARAERVQVRVTGPAARWSWVVPPELDVAAADEAVMTVGFRVPRTPDPPAGTLAFEIVAQPAAGPEARAAGTLTVTPFQDLAVELDPTGAGPTTATAHQVVVENRGNVPVTAVITASRDDADRVVTVGSSLVDIPPGERIGVPVVLGAGGRPLFRGRSSGFSVSASPQQGGCPPITVSGRAGQAAIVSGRTAAAVIAVAVLLVAVGLRFTVLAPGGSGSTAVGTKATTMESTEPGTGTPDGDGCVAAGHLDAQPIGTNPDTVASLPQDFSFIQIAQGGCLPVRWNPCEPVHFVINPANATPTGVDDTREAFKRLARATGITYLDDGLTDEDGRQLNRAYQPARYGEQWAPILVHWMANNRGQGSVQIVGGGLGTRVGDVYVSGILLLNPDAVSSPQTGTPIEGGFGDELTIGRIGPEGVTWGRIILHELAHVTGLGHVSDPGQLMYPEASDHTATTAFQKGDAAGLRLLGREAGCLETPTPSPQTDPHRGRRGGGGAQASATEP